MAEELAKLGAEVLLSEDSLTVKNCSLHAPTEPILSHGDHRVVMSMAVLATKYGGEIHRAEDVNKSFPDFFQKLISLGAKVELI